MLPITADKIAEVIILARELDRAENEFDAFVERLNEDEQAGLVAVFWIGRGSFEAEDIAEAIDTATREATVPTAEYLKGSPHLSDHLEAGLDALGVDANAAEDDLYRPA
jgi:GH24 family phage-related lysozyme (muramidase)